MEYFLVNFLVNLGHFFWLFLVIFCRYWDKSRPFLLMERLVGPGHDRQVVWLQMQIKAKS